MNEVNKLQIIRPYWNRNGSGTGAMDNRQSIIDNQTILEQKHNIITYFLMNIFIDNQTILEQKQKYNQGFNSLTAQIIRPYWNRNVLDILFLHMFFLIDNQTILEQKLIIFITSIPSNNIQIIRPYWNRNVS